MDAAETMNALASTRMEVVRTLIQRAEESLGDINRQLEAYRSVLIQLLICFAPCCPRWDVPEASPCGQHNVLQVKHKMGLSCNAGLHT